ncbi:MAG: hypothetical protein K2G56_06350 [Eubacterium sp.]|nr:hypothetical protein [Eubacterium sp.]
MSDELFKIRVWITAVSGVAFICSIIITLRGYYQNVDFFALLGILFFIFGMALMILAFIYPFIYKVEKMIDKMDEDEDQKIK